MTMFSRSQVELLLALCHLLDFNPAFEKTKKPVTVPPALGSPAESDYFKGLSNTQLREMLELANYLDIPRVLDGALGHTAYRLLQSMPPVGISLSKEEEAELEREYITEVEQSI